MTDHFKRLWLRSVHYAVLYVLLLCGTSACTTATSPPAEGERHTSDDSIRLVAEMYCTRCHLFPEPELLDKETWIKHVLPNMGYRFGIYSDRKRSSLLEKGLAGKMVEAEGVFPAKQTISNEAWSAIKRYYADRAPEKLVCGERSLPREPLPFVEVAHSFNLPRPAISALCFDGDARTLMVADCSLAKNSTIHVFDSTLKLITILGLPYPVSNMTIHNGSLYILMMGHLLPSDQAVGSLLKAIKDANGNFQGYNVILKHLKRPVDFAIADLDSDGDDDIVVCEYGNHTGGLSLFLKHGNDRHAKRVLYSGAGPVRAVVQDMNGDTHKDIVMLTAQGDERIMIYTNNGRGNFTAETVLRFPPTYGSVSFSLKDINQDGFLDIVYVNGDNADISRILKPYHGVRIFLNDSQNNFSEAFFFPMHGAYKTVTEDFDLDGDVDIAAISFFPDVGGNPEHGFAYLENRSEKTTLTFSASSFAGAGNGRWIAMTSGDVDSDGDVDIMLGSFTGMEITGDSSGRRLEHLQHTSPPFILLKNVAR